MAGRLLAKTDFEQRISAASGTVILEYPTLGWNVVRVWWTPDDIVAAARDAGIPDQSSDPGGDTAAPRGMVLMTFTDLERGRASLVSWYLIGWAACVRLEKLHPRSVLVRSGVVHLVRTGKVERKR